MVKKQRTSNTLRQQALFSNHLIEIIDDRKCPLIEG